MLYDPGVTQLSRVTVMVVDASPFAAGVTDVGEKLQLTPLGVEIENVTWLLKLLSDWILISTVVLSPGARLRRMGET